MKVPSITETAMIHGLMTGFSIIYVATLQTAFASCSTLAVDSSCCWPLGVYGPRGCFEELLFGEHDWLH